MSLTVLSCPPPPVSPLGGLALAVGDQEDHGFLFADVRHDGGQLVDVAAVEVLRLPQVQDHRGRTRFGCKEAHVSAERGADENTTSDLASCNSVNVTRLRFPIC